MEIIRPAILPGFLELLPKEQLFFNKIKSIIEENFQLYGFLPLDTPVIERSEILLAKGGGETTKQIYFIERDKRDMAMRFDLTVPLARYVAQHYHELEFPFRRYHIGKVYRGERNQRGRYREFYQCDIDIIGDRELDLKNDAEVPAVFHKIFTQIGIEARIHMNNRKLISGLFQSYEVEDLQEAIRLMDNVDKLPEDKFLESLEEVISSETDRQAFLEFLSFEGRNIEKLDYLKSLDIDNEIFNEGLAELEEVYEDILMLGTPEEAILIDLRIARGLDYYTGSVFETFIIGHEDIGSIASGGRYEELALNYTSQSLPGVGMSIGLTRLFFQLMEAGLIEDEEISFVDAMVLNMTEDKKYLYKVLDRLRSEGIKSMAHYEDARFGRKLRYADRLSIPYVIIIGQDELESSKVSLKDMITGDQELMTLDEAIEKIK